jgi:hypothetical protein
MALARLWTRWLRPIATYWKRSFWTSGRSFDRRATMTQAGRDMTPSSTLRAFGSCPCLLWMILPGSLRRLYALEILWAQPGAARPVPFHRRWVSSVPGHCCLLRASEPPSGRHVVAAHRLVIWSFADFTGTFGIRCISASNHRSGRVLVSNPRLPFDSDLVLDQSRLGYESRRASFGASYDEYRRQVGRWIPAIPSVTPVPRHEPDRQRRGNRSTPSSLFRSAWSPASGRAFVLRTPMPWHWRRR